MIVKIPAVASQEWRATLKEKRRQISDAKWQDPRPLYAFFGDSQVDLGDWYDLSAGAFAIRNCGLSRAKIEDVVTLIGALPDRNVDTVLLMCGINNLGEGEPVASCLEKYNKLLATAREVLRPRRIVAISVMPFRQSMADQYAKNINRNVLAFNEQLEAVCRRDAAVFVNISSAVVDANGGLANKFTFDGLHLNPDGYRAIADVICNQLSRDRALP